MRSYMGTTIERTFPAGYWIARPLKGGYFTTLRADTLAGLKQMIRAHFGR